MRQLPGAIIVIVFLGGFVYLMNHISDPAFNGDANFYTYIAVAIILFAALMAYWERIFKSGDPNP